jgi:hypothetical protein
MDFAGGCRLHGTEGLILFTIDLLVAGRSAGLSGELLCGVRSLLVR